MFVSDDIRSIIIPIIINVERYELLIMSNKDEKIIDTVNGINTPSLQDVFTESVKIYSLFKNSKRKSTSVYNLQSKDTELMGHESDYQTPYNFIMET